MDKKKILTVGLRGDVSEAATILSDPSNQYITDFFIGAPKEIGFTGRLKTYNTNLEILDKINQMAAKKGKTLSVVLNAWNPSLDPHDKKIKKKIQDFASALEDMKIDNITLSNPIWIKWVNNIKKNLKINLSLYANACSPLICMEFKKLGVDSICLPRQINKNIDLIRRIVDFVKIPVSIFVNSKCINSGACPYTIAHRLFKTSQPLLPPEKWDSFIDPFHRFCTARRDKSIFETIFTPLIRPEDLFLYLNAGVSVFKIATRQATPERTIKLVKAYGERNFRGKFGELWTVTPDTETPDNSIFDGIFEKIMHETEEKQFLYYKEFAKTIKK